MKEKTEIEKSGISIVIPAYNEEESVLGIVEKTYAVLSSVAGLPFEIIVVDDGSTDNTASSAPKDKCRLYRHPKNHGYGKTLLLGISKARYPYIGIIDADDTYNPEIFLQMLPMMDTFDMVIGARQLNDRSIMVKILRRLLKFLLYFFCEHISIDPNSGIRIFKKSLVEHGGHLFSKGFSFSTSLTFFAALNHCFIEYLPIDYGMRTGMSKVKHVRDSIRTLLLIISMSLVYRPVKCFSGLLLFFSLAISGLFVSKSRLQRETFLGLMFAAGISVLTLAISFLAFIQGKIYEHSLSGHQNR